MQKPSDYLSLYEAVKYCDYSQEYLSLRARQGKLRAVKINRNWVTTKEWLKDYTNSLTKRILVKPSKIIFPPNNLPIEKFSNVVYKRIKVTPSFLLLFTAFSILFFLSSILCNEIIISSFRDFDKLSKIVSRTETLIIQEIAKDVSQTFLEIKYLTDKAIRNSQASLIQSEQLTDQNKSLNAQSPPVK